MSNLRIYAFMLDMKNVYSLKDTLESVTLISELVPLELESSNNGETKLVHKRKLTIMELL